MTTLRDLVQKGLRESGIIAVGTEPDADVFEETLDHLQTIIKSLFGNELGVPLQTYDVGLIDDGLDNLFPNNVRLVFNASEATTLYLNPEPDDGARLQIIDNLGNFSTYPLTLQGNGRRIEGQALLTLDTDLENRTWFYRDDLGDWVRVTGLTAEDSSPFPDEFDDFLTTLLAVRINPRYGAETKQETKDVMNRARSQLRSRYRQSTEMPSEDALIFLPSSQRYILSSFARGM